MTKQSDNPELEQVEVLVGGSEGDSIESLYKRILDVVNKMYVAASKEDWASVLELGGFYRACVQDLKKYPDPAPEDEATRGRLTALIKSILQHDAATRNFIQPEMARLGRLLVSGSRQRHCSMAYESMSLGTFPRAI